MKSNQSAICLQRRREEKTDSEKEPDILIKPGEKPRKRGNKQNHPRAASPAALAPLSITASIPGYHHPRLWISLPASLGISINIPGWFCQHPWVPLPTPLGITASISGYCCQHPWVSIPASLGTTASIPGYQHQHPWVPPWVPAATILGSPPPPHFQGRILVGMPGAGSLAEPRHGRMRCQGRMRPPPAPAGAD